MFVLAQTLLTDNDKVSHLESLFITSQTNAITVGNTHKHK